MKTPALLVVVSLLAVAPLAMGQHPPVSRRLAVGFDHMPDGLVEHGDYLGASVQSVDRALGFAVVLSGDASGFRGQALQHGAKWVEEDALQPLALSTPNDPMFAASQYGPQFVGAPAAWDAAPVSALPTVCILDSGARLSHQDLASRYAGGIDLVNGDSDPTDDFGHGTHVTGIAVAATNNTLGIAGVSRAPFLMVKVLDATGNGYQTNVATGIRWCADHGAKVISMSLGASAGMSALQDAVAYAKGKGALMFAAAGNGNSCANCVEYPAKYTDVIAVGCVDQYRNPCAFASTGPEVDLAGPGNAIQSTCWTSDACYTRGAGTSMSTPHVAGAAALVWGAHPDWTNDQVRQALESSAQDVGSSGTDVQTGHGLVRADLAQQASVSGPAPPPAPAPAPAPSASVAMSPASQAKNVAARASVTYTFTVTNQGSANDTVKLSAAASRSGWGVALSASSLSLAPGASATVQLTVTAPAKSAPMTVTLTALSGLDAAVKATGTAQSTLTK
jgi:thermitase